MQNFQGGGVFYKKACDSYFRSKDSIRDRLVDLKTLPVLKIQKIPKLQHSVNHKRDKAMQFLVSLKSSEPWKQIVDSCQLITLDKIYDINDPHTKSSDTTSYCIRSALTLADLTQLLTSKETQLVLSLDAPETVVAELLQQGKSLNDAVLSWHQQMVSILELQQQHRRQLQLAQADGLLLNPAQAPGWFAKSFSAIADVTQRFSHDIYSLIASQALRQNHEAHITRERLIACSLPLLDDPYINFDLEVMQQTAIVSKKQQLEEYKGENELILQQLFQAQEELDQLLVENKTLVKECQVLKQAREDEVAGLTNKLKASEQALRTSKNQQSKLQNQQSKLQNQHDELKTQLTESQTSLEKASRAHEETKQKLSESENKNELLLQQLTQTQKDLEQNLFHYRQLENDSKHQQMQYQRMQSKLEQKLKKAAAEEVNIKHQLAAAQSELKVISASKLWKSVEPVRKLSKALNVKSRKREQLQQDVALIMTSEYFDIIWYLQSYSDVAESGMNPAEHYLCFGAEEGRAPGPLFDSNWYLSQYPDVAESGINPLLHYVKFGAQEGRTASPKLLQHQKGAN